MKNEVDNIIKFANGKYPGPVVVELLFGEGCNQNCKFCSLHDGRDAPLGVLNHPGKLSDSDYLRIIKDCAKLGVKRIQLSGEGEPLFKRKLAIPLMKLIKKYGIYGYLNTNGGLFQDEDIKQLVELGWDKILFSIESPDPKTHNYIVSCKGAHERSINNIKKFNFWKKKLNKTAPEIEMKMVVTNRNYFQVEEMVKFSQKLEVNLRLDSLIVFHDYGKRLALNEQEKKKFNAHLKNALKLAEGSKYWFSVSDELFENIVSKTDNHYSKDSKNEIKKFHFPKLSRENPFVSTSCYFPWLRILINVQGFAGPCGFAYTKDNVKEKSLIDIWKGEEFTKLRKNRLNHVLGEYCHLCGDIQGNSIVRQGFIEKAKEWKK
jgi:MoaA/NifB/PqqE/SkfB family radical SAM enzyme